MRQIIGVRKKNTFLRKFGFRNINRNRDVEFLECDYLLAQSQIMFHKKSSSHDFDKKNFGYGSNRRKKTFPDGWCLSQNHGGKLSLLSCLHRRWPEKGTPSAVLHTTSIPLPWKVRPRLLEKVQIKTHITWSYVSNQKAVLNQFCLKLNVKV